MPLGHGGMNTASGRRRVTTRKFGLLFGNKGRRKKVEYHDTEFGRNMSAAAHTSAGYRVRKFKVKEPANKPPTKVI